MPQDPFAEFGGNTVSAPPPPQTAPVQSSDPFAEFGGHSLSTPPIASARAIAPPSPVSQGSEDPFAQFGGHTVSLVGTTKAPQTEQPEASSWLGKSWNWLNEPLLNLHREGATGIEAGAEDFASGLTSPLNVALTIGTMGAGPLLESLGLKIAGEAALPVIKTIGKLAKAGFTSQMVYGLAQEYPQFQVALKNGDTDKALEVGTKLALGGALAFHGAREVAKDVGLVDSKARANTGVDEARGERESTAQSVYQEARKARAAVMENVANEVRRGAVQLFAEAGGDTAKLAEWKKRIDTADQAAPPVIPELADWSREVKPTVKENGIWTEASTTPKIIFAAEQALKDRGFPPENIARLRKMAMDIPEVGVGPRHGELYAKLLQDAIRKHDDVVASEPVGKHPALPQENAQRTALIDPKLQRQVSSLLDIAQNLKPAEVEAAGALRQFYDSIGQQGVDAGLLNGEKLGKYVARSRWTVEPAEADALEAAKQNLNQQAGRADHLQRRVFESTVDGVLAGFKPKSLDAADIAGDYGTSLGRELGNKAYVDGALKARAADGRPIAIPTDAVRFANDGTRLDTSDYSSVPSPHSKGVEFHPDALKQARLVLAPERSALADVPGAKTLLKLSSLAKETKLIGGFHWSQIGLRNLMSGINPFTTEAIDLTDPRQAKMVSAGGLQLATPRENAFTEESEAGGGGLLSKVPGVGKFIKLTNDKLFGPNGYIDQSKMKAALSFSDRLKKAHPDWDEPTVMRYAGEMANNRFGGQNWTAMEKNQTYRDLMRTVFLAPDFLISNIKDGLSALGPAGRVSRFDIARIVALNFVAARVANALVSGKPHYEQPFGVVSPDGKEVYSVRTMPADIFGGLADPRRFAGNRLSPLLNTAQEVVEGRDKLGRKRSTQEQLTDLFGQFTPLPTQSAYQLATGGSPSDFRPVDSVISSLGLSATKNYSPAERKALELASHYSTSGEATPAAQLDKLHEVMKLEDSIRSGQVSLDAALAALQSGQISRQDFKNIRKVAREQEQFPQTARLRAQVRRLPLAAALDVWKLADDNEKKDLLPLLHAKAQNWRKNAARTATPRQRADMQMRLAELASDVLGK